MIRARNVEAILLAVVSAVADQHDRHRVCRRFGASRERLQLAPHGIALRLLAGQRDDVRRSRRQLCSPRRAIAAACSRKRCSYSGSPPSPATMKVNAPPAAPARSDRAAERRNARGDAHERPSHSLPHRSRSSHSRHFEQQQQQEHDRQVPQVQRLSLDHAGLRIRNRGGEAVELVERPVAAAGHRRDAAPAPRDADASRSARPRRRCARRA